MSVAAMIMDDQRPLMNSFDKMSKQYEQNVHGGGVVGGAASGPASPTPSGSEEPPIAQHPYHHHHHHHHHHQQQFHHRHQVLHAPTAATAATATITSEQQQQQQQQTSATTTTTTSQQQQPTIVSEAVAAVEQRQRLLEEEIESLKNEQIRLSQQCADAQRREKILMRRLANKEQEFQDYLSQIAEYKAAQAPSALALRSALLDPAVNLLFDKLKKELKATKAKLEETQNELAAWKFTPDSNTGKRLMAKCRLLYQENEELGKMTSNGRLAKLEAELAMQKSFSDEVKKSQSELDDFLQELDEDVEGMQSTILFLQQELKTTRDRIQVLEKENYQLKNGMDSDGTIAAADVAGIAKDENNDTVDQTTVTHATINSKENESSNTEQQQQHMPATNTENVNVKYQKTTQLDTIVEEEHACQRPTNSAVNAIYNGNEDPKSTPVVTIVDDAGNSNSSSNGSSSNATAPAKRKRNYESDSNDNVNVIAPTNATTLANTTITNVITHVPRTLPPKKSKLRVTAARRASMQANELQEQDIAGLQQQATLNDAVAVNMSGNTTEVVSMGVDNAVAGMANEETTVTTENLAMQIDEAVAGIDAAGGVAQRIMTRRRSVRAQQQNGDGNH